MSRELDAIITNLRRRQNVLLMELRMYAVATKDMLQKFVTKIDEEGTRGYYSVNHDSLEKVRRLHKVSMELSYTRGWLERLEKERDEER